MNIYQFLKLKKVWIGLIVFVVIYASMNKLLRTYSSNASVSRQEQNQDCHPFDPQTTLKTLFYSFFSVQNDSLWLARPAIYSPSFQELHSLLFGPKAPNLYEAWPNFFKKKLDSTYPHTSLTQSLFTKILDEIDIPVNFVVEVGSFMGQSTTNIGKTFLSKTSTTTFLLLCIDTWLGGLEHWVNSRQRSLMEIVYGRPIVYEQFIANIVANNLTKYVIPYSTTSILGARFLLEKKMFPQIIYLDSAHLEGETYVELELYWLLLQVGGILMGDDWVWMTVRCDVLRFSHTHKLNVSVTGNTWLIKK